MDSIKFFGTLREIIRQMEMLDSLFKHATEGIIVVDKTGGIVMVNPKAVELFGYQESELPGERIEALIPERFAKSHAGHRDRYFVDAKARGMGSQMDLHARRKDGSEFPVEVSLSPFQTSDGEFVVAFVIDITHRKQQEKSILEANQQIQMLNADLEDRVRQRTNELANAIKAVEKSEREVLKALEKERQLNVMKSQFVTVASHEFRTPLATILSSSSLISRYTTTEDDEKRQKHIHRIKSSVNNLTEILNDFLSIGKLEEGKIRMVPVLMEYNEFCKDIIEEVKGLCREGQMIHFEQAPRSQVWLDKQLLRNVLFNLLSNAIKYSAVNAHIFFRTIQIDECICVEIQDEGIGIPQSDQEHIFDRFFRATNAGTAQGTGLGLNIVKGYVELMGGTIGLTSELGKGTTFRISLPDKTPASDVIEQPK